MKANTRMVVESPVWQGKDEELAYVLDTSEWGGSPTSPVCKIYNDKTDEDLTATNLDAGDPSISGDSITSQPVIDLVSGTDYRLEFQWTSSGNIFEAALLIHGQK